MKHIRLLTDQAFADLKSNIHTLAPKFLEDRPWVTDYFGDADWYFDLDVQYESVDLIISKDPKTDIENCKKIYDFFKHIPIYLAADDRFWSYLNLYEYWNYMQVRWSDSNNKSQENTMTLDPKYLTTMYKGGPGTNGIARLWWFAHLTYDEQRKNPYELTEFLLSKQDYTYIFLNRTFSRNKRIFLTVLSELKEQGLELNGSEMREFAKYISLRGSVALLDVLDLEDIRSIVREYLDEKTIEYA